MLLLLLLLQLELLLLLLLSDRLGVSVGGLLGVAELLFLLLKLEGMVRLRLGVLSLVLSMDTGSIDPLTVVLRLRTRACLCLALKSFLLGAGAKFCIGSRPSLCLSLSLSLKLGLVELSLRSFDLGLRTREGEGCVGRRLGHVKLRRGRAARRSR